MRIERKEQFNIEVLLSWDDFVRLDKGETITDKYDGENKLFVHITHLFNPEDYK